MKKFLPMAAVAAILWIGTANHVQGFSWGGGGCAPSMGGGFGGFGGFGMMPGLGFGGYAPSGGYAMSGGGAVVAQTPSTEATLIVNLPEDATLTIEGEETTSTSSERVFVSPALEPGKEYEYTLKAKVIRDGQVQTATARVTVRPGKVSRVELKVPARGVAAQ